MKFEKSTHYSVTYKDQEYIRFGNDCWYQYYGSSLEPVSDCSELDKVFMDTHSPMSKETAPVELKTLNRQYPNISTDLEKIETEWKTQGIKYHKVFSESGSGYCGLGFMNPNDKEGFIYVPSGGLIELWDYGQLSSFIEFDNHGRKASADEKYKYWWTWLSIN